MLLSNLVGERTKENPSDAVIKSHALLVRAGFIKLVANGIWTMATPALRICQKIEKIIREEMDAIGGQEVLFPVVMPRELMDKSGRYESIDESLVRFKDRNDRGLVLGMTHEEAAVHFCKNTVSSYQQLPFMVYQIQTKFRDEARARGGLIRVREFTMKDAYSFHLNQTDLEEYYEKVYHAYNRIFEKIGMKNFVSIKSDSGMMGGNIAHEYMLLTDIGEDTIVICSNCDYKSNMEVAECYRKNQRDEVSQEMQEVFTGDKKQIDEISEFLKTKKEKTVKAVSYNIKGSNEIVLVFIRGDLEVNEAKLKKIVKKEIVPSDLSKNEEIIAGNIGPIDIKFSNGIIIYDKSIEKTNNMVCGANKENYHIIGVDIDRDLKEAKFFDVAKVQKNDRCPICGKRLKLNNGIEVGNIFQLGTKYTKSMDMVVVDREGNNINPVMGCYGIGVGRALASIAEESNDEFGLNWPINIAPWQVHLCALRLDNKEVRENAEKLYNDMQNSGIEVLYDDRDVSAGIKFSDCDLMGMPIRLVISPRSLANNSVELQFRNKLHKRNVELSKVTTELIEILQQK